MALTAYLYSISSDTLNGKVGLDSLLTQISSSSIVTALERIDTDSDELSIVFKQALSSGDKTILDGIVATHKGEATFIPTEVKIVEESVKTGGRFQCRNVVMDVTSSGTIVKDVEWPIPVNLLSAEFVIESEHLGDGIECAASPHTVIGTLSSGVSASGTDIPLNTPAFGNIEVGLYAGYTTNMVDFQELGVVTALDPVNKVVTLSEPLPALLPSGTPIYIEAKFVVDFELHNQTRHTIGDTKVGASYVDAGTKLQFRYFNNSGSTSKKFTIMLEYLY